MNFIMRDGRRIEIETLEIDLPPSAKRRRREPFAQITATQTARLRSIENATTIKIFLDLLFMSFQSHGRPFALPSAPDATSRNKRHRALGELERCALISVQRNRGRPALIAIRVTPHVTPP